MGIENEGLAPPLTHPEQPAGNPKTGKDSSMSDFTFGQHAIQTPESEPRFAERRDSIVASIRPANLVESIFAEELLHASWEMERVRNNSANTAAEPRLTAAYSRASRNWHRSLKQLKKLQSARASHYTQICCPADIEHTGAAPLADIAKLHKPLHFPNAVTPEVQ